MKILTVHNKYKFRGGEDVVREDEQSLLAENGHEIVSYISDNKAVSASNLIVTGMKTVWSRESYRRVREILSRGNFDVMHCHNTFPLISPAVYYAARAENVPVVQTLHNYRLLCPSAQLYRDHAVCENCLGKTVAYPGIAHACYRQSRLGSATVAAMLAVHRFLKTYQERIDVYIALTEFARQKYIEGGLPAEKIVVKPNFVCSDPQVGAGEGDYAVFVGRLSPEKGIGVLLDAWRKIGAKMPLKIIGEGPLQAAVERAAASQPEIEYLGAKNTGEIYSVVGRARVLIFTSEWYEGLPKVIIEAFAKGTPVISTNLGAMQSVIEHEKNGLHYAPGDIEGLCRQVEWMLDHPKEWRAMRGKARLSYETKYTAAVNYPILMGAYEKAVRRASAGNSAKERVLNYGTN